MKFSELSLRPGVLSALKEMRYEDLTPIQEAAIPPILDGRDVVGVAETGSGKTGACGIPLVHMVDVSVRKLQAMILVPTRELAQQYVAELADIAQYTPVAPFAMFGGFDMSIQRAKMRDVVHILVATPGRLIDFLWNNPLDLSQVRTVVLDEADEMLKMGFIENVDFIMSCLVHEHQTLLFSATMPRAVSRLTESYLKNPVRIELNKDQVAPQSLAHHFQHVGREGRLRALEAYLEKEEIEQAILFCNTRSSGNRLFRELQRRFRSVDMIHGGLEQPQRTSIFNRFRNKDLRLLVATDVAGRGLDFDHVSHVINYDFPQNEEMYTHRTGRAGRMGRTGVAMTFVTDRDLRTLKQVLASNRIEPVWRGEEPGIPSGSRKRGGDRAPGRNRRRGGRRRRRSS